MLPISSTHAGQKVNSSRYLHRASSSIHIKGCLHSWWIILEQNAMYKSKQYNPRIPLKTHTWGKISTENPTEVITEETISRHGASTLHPGPCLLSFSLCLGCMWVYTYTWRYIRSSVHTCWPEVEVSSICLYHSPVSCDSLGRADVLDWLVRDPPGCPADMGLGDHAQGLKRLTAGPVPLSCFPCPFRIWLTHHAFLTSLGSMMVDFPFTLSILKNYCTI